MKDDIHQCSPTVITQYIGQQSVLNRVLVSLEACWNDSKKFPSCLLCGSPGLGKSLLCRVLAAELQSKMIEIMAQNITSPRELNNILLGLNNRDILYVDEADELLPQVSTALYRAIEDGLIFVAPQGKAPTKIELNDITIMLCTNYEHQLVKPLRERMKMVLRFELYTSEEINTILRHTCMRLGWQIDEETLREVSVRSKGVPRTAKRLLEGVHTVARSMNETILSLQHAKKAFELENINKYGLGKEEMKYLDLLNEHDCLRLNVISSCMNIPAKTIQAVIEPHLLHNGWLIISDKGREITMLGRKMLEELKNGEASQ